MKKIIKLLIIAPVLFFAIIGIISVIFPDKKCDSMSDEINKWKSVAQYEKDEAEKANAELKELKAQMAANEPVKPQLESSTSNEKVNSEPRQKKTESDTNSSVPPSVSPIDWSVLDRVDASLSTIDELEKEAKNRGENIPKKYQTRIKVLKFVINYIKTTGQKPSAEGLSKAQAHKLIQIWPMEMKDGEKQPKNLSKYKGRFKNIQSISELEEEITYLKNISMID